MLHGIDTAAFVFQEDPDDYLLFLGRFTEGKGVIQAIDVARRVQMKLLLVAAENDYYRGRVKPLVDGVTVAYAGEADHAAKVALYGGARALLYPVQTPEPFQHAGQTRFRHRPQWTDVTAAGAVAAGAGRVQRPDVLPAAARDRHREDQ